MQYFPIIQALCRASVANPDAAVRKQVERLRDALAENGEKKEADALSSLLASAERTKDLTPSRLTRSRSIAAGEDLSPNTALPVDRETSVPLAQVIFPEDGPGDPPVFNETVGVAVSSIVEEWANHETLKKLGIEAPRSCLIYGPPGTGKTHLALWMARQLRVPAVLAKLDGLMSSFLGTTSRNIGALFNFAARYRCVLLLDEFDAVAKLRDDPQEVGEIKRVVNTLLQNLDLRRDSGLTIGITNHHGLLDPAVWRRFEVQLEIPKPSFKVRAEIARRYMPPLPIDEARLRLLAWFTAGTTGAEIESLVRSLKKSVAMQDEKQQGLIQTLRQFATLNSGRIDEQRRSLIFGEPIELAKAMIADQELNFGQSDVAEIFGNNKATISRWLSRAQSRDGAVAVG